MIDLGTFLQRTFLARTELYCVRFLLQYLPPVDSGSAVPPPTLAYVTLDSTVSDLVLNVHGHKTVIPLFRWEGYMKVCSVEMKGKDVVVYYRKIGDMIL